MNYDFSEVVGYDKFKRVLCRLHDSGQEVTPSELVVRLNYLSACAEESQTCGLNNLDYCICSLNNLALFTNDELMAVMNDSVDKLRTRERGCQ